MHRSLSFAKIKQTSISHGQRARGRVFMYHCLVLSPLQRIFGLIKPVLSHWTSADGIHSIIDLPHLGSLGYEDAANKPDHPVSGF